MAEGYEYTEAIHKRLVRQAKREKWQRITYHTNQNGVRNGWLLEDTGKVMRIRLVGELKNRRIPQKERDYVRVVS
jgi:hypothetical protein